MTSWFRIFGLVVLVSVLCEYRSAWGQGGRRSPMRRYQSSVNEPFVSSYLNLARPGADPGFNYFTLVQPQLQQQRNAEINASRIQSVNGDLQQTKVGAYGPMGGIRPTGRGATYGNYSHFYPSLGGGGGRGARRYQSSASSGAGGMGVY
jgi:hypothetical protein